MPSLNNIIASHIDDNKGIIYTSNHDSIYSIFKISSGEIITSTKLKLPYKLPTHSKLVAMSKDNIFYASESNIIRFHVPSKKNKEYTLTSIGNFTGITAIKINSSKNALLVGDLTGP